MPPQEILQRVIDGPVSELLREHAISSLDDLFHSILAKLDAEGTRISLINAKLTCLIGKFLIEMQEGIMKEATEHLVSDILYKISNTINETQLADQIWGVCSGLFASVEGIPFAKVFQQCLSAHAQSTAKNVADTNENPIKKLFDYLLQVVIWRLFFHFINLF